MDPIAHHSDGNTVRSWAVLREGLKETGSPAPAAAVEHLIFRGMSNGGRHQDKGCGYKGNLLHFTGALLVEFTH